MFLSFQYDRRSDSVTDKYANSLGGHKKDSEVGSGNDDDTYEDEEENVREDDLSDPDYLEDDSFAYDDDAVEDTSDETSNNVPKDSVDDKRFEASSTIYGNLFVSLLLTLFRLNGNSD
jgi:hypothetical protein